MLAFRNTENRYGLVAIGLHWGMALMIMAMLALGLIMVEMPLGASKLQAYGWHKALGALVLFLALLRLGWRLMGKVPSLPAGDALWQKKAASIVHRALYVLMLAMPVSGWLMSSAAGFPVSVFGWVTLPNLISPNKELLDLFKEIHELLAWCLIGAVCAHAGAAFFHNFIKKDNLLRRMLPLFLYALCLTFPWKGEAAPIPSWKIVPAESSLSFTAVQNNAPVTGTFMHFTGEILFDPLQLEKSHARIEIRMDSVSASYAEVASTLQAADWFDVAQFPKAVWESTAFSREGENRYNATGILTLRDKKAPVSLTFVLEEYSAKKARVKGSFHLQRTLWGVGQEEWAKEDVVKDEVKGEFSLSAVPAAEKNIP